MDYNTQPAPYNQYDPYSQQSQPARPAIQLPTNRGLLKFILLTIITFGIYGLVVWCKLSTEINTTASKYDGKSTMHYIVMVILTCITCGIFSLIWFHQYSARVGAELRRRNIAYSFDASDFWIWFFLGSLIVLGPLVYLHKVLKAQNLINEHYNTYG